MSGNPVWPAGLPSHVAREGYEEDLGENVVRTPMETGPAKRRRRSTAARPSIRCKIWLTPAQRALLLTFFTDTLVDGTLPFDWLHPVTRRETSFAFQERPRIIKEAGTGFSAGLRLEVIA